MWCVLDIETTGLNPREDWILEIATVIVEPTNLEAQAVGRTNILHPMHGIHDRMGAYVNDMHTASGLLAEIASGDGLGSIGLDAHVAGWLRAHGATDKSVTLIGNSIHFDRSFLEVHAPKIYALLHHRMIDVSTLNVLTDTWMPGARVKPPVAHRALADCMSSLEQLREHRARLWVR